MKSAARWRQEWGAPARDLVARGIVDRAMGVYLGETSLELEDFRIYPVHDFLGAQPDLLA